MLRSDVGVLNIAHQHALRPGALPPYHRDPFDRMRIAQAQLEGLPMMTGDTAFAAHNVESVPA
jgi:PIN domain nuclease of toxin-antitoxin system